MKSRQKSETTRHWWWQIAITAAIIAMATACGDPGGGGGGGTGTITSDFALTPVTTCDEVRDHMAEAKTEEAIDYLYGNHYRSMGPEGQPAEDSANNDSGASGGGEEPADYTETNVQEEGVDEPDIVKTDGTHVYAVSDGALQILNSWPPEDTDLVSRYDFHPSVTPNNLFLDGDRAVVFSYQYGQNYYETEPTSDGENSGEDDTTDDQEVAFRGTRISILDVSDTADPQLERQFEIEGHYTDGRMIDGKVYLVTNSGLRTPSVWQLQDNEELELPERDYEETEEDLEQMREEARPILREYFGDQFSEESPEDWLPHQRISDGDGNVLSSGLIHECTDLYLPSVAAELGVLNISSFDLDGEAELDTTGLVSNGWQVYASEKNLYVAMSSRNWMWGPWGWGDQENESHIHQFQLLGEDDPQYMASGRVDGWILDQFSFSEHNNHLRVATTDNQWQWDDETQEAEDEGGNHMIVLKRQGGELVETGSVRNLAPTERIYSVRFNGDRGYMVTFRRVDPLYTFDLSDPYNPRQVGELKIEGFSSYMHPLDDDHLLAIGLDGDDDGMLSGVHLQVFDVSDMDDPQRTQHHVISTGSWSSYSEAMNDHHAFTYQDELGVLSVPVNIREDGEFFNGLILFEATTEGIEEIGRVDHTDLLEQWYCEESNQTDMEGCSDGDEFPYWWRARMRRSILMSGEDGGEYVYSLSDMGLKVNETFDTDQELASVLLRE